MTRRGTEASTSRSRQPRSSETFQMPGSNTAQVMTGGVRRQLLTRALVGALRLVLAFPRFGLNISSRKAVRRAGRRLLREHTNPEFCSRTPSARRPSDPFSHEHKPRALIHTDCRVRRTVKVGSGNDSRIMLQTALSAEPGHQAPEEPPGRRRTLCCQRRWRATPPRPRPNSTGRAGERRSSWIPAEHRAGRTRCVCALGPADTSTRPARMTHGDTMMPFQCPVSPPVAPLYVQELQTRGHMNTSLRRPRSALPISFSPVAWRSSAYIQKQREQNAQVSRWNQYGLDRSSEWSTFSSVPDCVFFSAPSIRHPIRRHSRSWRLPRRFP